MTLSLNGDSDEQIIAAVKLIVKFGADVSLHTYEMNGKVDRTITISYRTRNEEAKSL